MAEADVTTVKGAEKAPEVRMVHGADPNKIFHGLNLRHVQAVSFEPSGTAVLYDYNIPAVYTKYSKEKRPSSNYKEPYRRYGSDNLYPFFVLKMSKSSTTLKRGYRTAAGLAFGSGVRIEGAADADAVKVREWMAGCGLTRKLLRKVLKNQSLYGGFYVQAVFSTEVEMDRLAGTASSGLRLVKLECLPWHNCRPGKKKGRDPKAEDWMDRGWVARDFSLGASAQDRLVLGYPWLPKEGKPSTGDVVVDERGKAVPQEEYVYVEYVYEEGLSSDVFPDPHWETGTSLNAAMLEAAEAAYSVSALENGLTASHIIAVPFVETADAEKDKEDKAAILAKIQGQMIGSGNAERAVVLWSDPRTEGEPITVASIPSSDREGVRESMREMKDRLFCTAFGVTDERLLSIPPMAGKGLSAQDNALSQAEDMWYNSVILPEVAMPVAEWVTGIAKRFCPAWKEGMSVSFRRSAMVPRYMEPVLMEKVMTTDEIRAVYGMPPLTPEQAAELDVKLEKSRTTVRRIRQDAAEV